MNTVTISLNEYEDLKANYNILIKAIEKRQDVYTTYFGYNIKFHLVDDSEIKQIVESNKLLSEENGNLKKELNKPKQSLWKMLKSYL
jgi:hypothetical protein